MTDLNNVVVMGRLTKDLDENSFGYAGSTARANVSIAVNRSRKVNNEWKDEVSYFDVTIWGKTAENLKPYLTKGKQIVVEGFLKQDRWEKNGQKFYKVGIVANNVHLVGGNNHSSTNQTKPLESNPTASGDNSQQPFQEDIPF